MNDKFLNGNSLNTRPLRTLIVIAASLYFTGCVTPRANVSAQQAERVQSERDLQAQSLRTFELQGRIAIKNANDGGSGRFAWKQEDEVIAFELSAPLSNQTWTLEGMPGSYVLTDSKGQPRHNADARRLVFDASGWIVPMFELSYWVRGARAPEANSGVAKVHFDAKGDIRSLQQGGWLVTYERFADVNGKRLPIKLKATQDDAQVKVVVQKWN